MKFLSNFLLFSVFTVLVSVATFYPLSMIRVVPVSQETTVLGESTGPNSLNVDQEGSISGSVVSVSGLVYPGQNSYFNSAFKIENNSDEAKTYKLSVVKVNPVGLGLSVFATGPSGDTITIRSRDSGLVNIVVSFLEGTGSVPIKFIARVAILSIP